MKNIYKSIAGLQQEIEVIHKDTQGNNYTYADLPAIFKTLNPMMKTHGLGFYQLVNIIKQDEKFVDTSAVVTVVFHIESGESIQSVTAIPQGVEFLNKDGKKMMNDFQVLGSAITYLRRYALSAMLGLVTDKDTDASGEQAPKATPRAGLKFIDNTIDSSMDL